MTEEQRKALKTLEYYAKLSTYGQSDLQEDYDAAIETIRQFLMGDASTREDEVQHVSAVGSSTSPTTTEPQGDVAEAIEELKSYHRSASPMTFAACKTLITFIEGALK